MNKGALMAYLGPLFKAAELSNDNTGSCMDGINGTLTTPMKTLQRNAKPG
jgi:hypothetical protein